MQNEACAEPGLYLVRKLSVTFIIDTVVIYINHEKSQNVYHWTIALAWIDFLAHCIIITAFKTKVTKSKYTQNVKNCTIS